MSSRIGWLIPALYASLVFAACAEGAPAAPPGEIRADPALGLVKAVCGDGMKDKTEACDCPMGASTMCKAPPETTCATLGMGTGDVYCAAGQCQWITSMCSMPTMNGGGGSGAGRGG